MSTGSINAYTKNLKLQMQWELKQRQGDFSSHKAPSPDGSCQEEDEEQSKQRLFGQLGQGLSLTLASEALGEGRANTENIKPSCVWLFENQDPSASSPLE